MTPMTTARPTIVRTMPPPPVPPTDSADLPGRAVEAQGRLLAVGGDGEGRRQQDAGEGERGRAKIGRRDLHSTEERRLWIGVSPFHRPVSSAA